MNRSTIFLIVALMVITAMGTFLTTEAMDEKEQSMRNDLMAQSKLAALGVNVTQILALNGTFDDIESSDYSSLKALLVEDRNAMKDIRFIYIVGQLSNDTIFFYVDSEPSSSPDYSPPGQVYDEAKDEFDLAFTGNASIVGPSTDRWGTWTSALIPLRDPNSGDVVAVLGADMDSSDWGWWKFMAGLPYILTSILIATLIIIFFIMRKQKEIENRTLAESAKALQQANAKLGIMNSITRHDINNQLTVLTGYLSLSRTKETDPILVSYFDKMFRATANVKEQIAFTKDYQEIGVLAPSWVLISRQIDDAFAMLHPLNVTLVNETDGIELLVDRLAEKVPYNLIDNSVRHGGNVTQIKMSVKQVGEALLILYEDDGVGISMEDRNHLFERGYGKNTGLGLFLIREMLAFTGITITENGQTGKGVRFEILVPPDGWRRLSPQ